MEKFRLLKAEEIECRVSRFIESPNFTGLFLLLYKDARCDMRILDETVGAMNWQCEYSRDNANCTVSIWDNEKDQWISKEDTGTESDTEREKGLASDSFKRACFKWGIGRELYTSPTIMVDKGFTNMYKDKNDKWRCYDKFVVQKIGYDNGRISELVIVNEKSNNVAFRWSAEKGATPFEDDGELATQIEKNTFYQRCKLDNVDYRDIAKQAGAVNFKTMTKEEVGKALIILGEIEEAKQDA